MHTKVTRDQFEIREESVVHMPTGAEFTPHSQRKGSAILWLGELGNRLPSGEDYQYNEVLALMKALWSERSLTRRSELAGA
jgi:hypothetical protein